MQSTVLLGRFGRLTISLHYTWLFIVVLGLWGLALGWLPDNFPGWSAFYYWLTAMVVMSLFILIMVMREVLRAAVAGFSKRGIVLYPFGAGLPYRADEIGGARIVASVFSTLFFNFILGGVILLLLKDSTATDGVVGILRALLVPLAVLTMWVGLLNLIPGIPFDGGRAFTNGLYLFSNVNESGLGFVRAIGELASVGLVLGGAWVALNDGNWIIALALVVIAWGAKDADEKGRQFGALRTGLSEIHMREIMSATNPADAVPSTATVAQMVMSHRYDAPDLPLPVIERQPRPTDNGARLAGGVPLEPATAPQPYTNGRLSGEMVGIVTLSQADELLQGDWPTTPVTALMSRPSEILSLDADTSLSIAVETVEGLGKDPQEQPSIPILEQGTLVGSLDPSRLQAFEEAELGLGVTEASLSDPTRNSLRSRLGGLVPALFVIVLMAVVGNMVASSHPDSVRSLRNAPVLSSIAITATQPLPDSVVPVAPLIIQLDITGPQDVSTATILLDSLALPVVVSGDPRQGWTLTSQVAELAAGQHTIYAAASDRTGSLAYTAWKFQAGAQETATPVATPAPQVLDISRRKPAPGGLVLVDQPAQIQLLLRWSQVVTQATLLVDGAPVPASVEQAAQDATQLGTLYRLSGTTAALAAGNHDVRFSVSGGDGGQYTADWSFSAIAPDDQHLYFPETGYFVSRDFYDFWQQNGGVAIFGYPISDRVAETETSTGESYIAQYFERARFELHPQSGNAVMLGKLGMAAHTPDPPSTLSPGAQFFPETGHNLSGQFLDYWKAHGGLAIFGYPISEVLTETNPQDGQQYQVQYFERARFELHPELAGTPYEVQLGQLGTLIYESK